MKIGELAEKCGVSKDTIRYYVQKGLLIPAKSGAQMDFTHREYQDMQFIQKMKRMQFNIREMQEIFTLRRLSNFIEPDTIQAYQKILDEKQRALLENIHVLQDAYQTVEAETKALAASCPAKKHVSGVPLKALSVLYCPHCKKQLMVENAQISNSYVSSGELACDCGYRAAITDGIVQTGNKYQGLYDKPDLKRGLYRDVGEEFVIGFEKSSDLVWNSLQELGMKGKIVMETNINGYFFLYNQVRRLEHDCLYIITDRYAEMLSMYKDLIETLGMDLQILFIADDSDNLPLKDGCADILLDYYGSNEQVLYKKESFIQRYQKYISDSAVVLGALFGFEAGSASVRKVPEYYPECSKNALNAAEMLKTYEAEGYRLIVEEVAETTRTYNQYSFACHKDGERLILYYYEAQR